MKAKKHVGRPKEIDAEVFQKSITVDEKTIKALMTLGSGNLSMGVREAVRILRQLKIVL